ncbi:MAG: DUF4364 family protein [Clostridia bacterium]|nr:DUF4364 family protein [Clostridia bacterium]
MSELNTDNTDFPESYDTFSEGVELGGLRNTAQIKTLICYIVKKINTPLRREKIGEIFQLHGIANYFAVSQALEELISAGSLKCDADGVLSLTPQSLSALYELEKEIPKSVREKALEDAVMLETMERRKSETKIETEFLEKGVNITFTLMNGDEVLMKLTVYAADENQVDSIKNNYLKDPAGLYAGIVSKLFV